MSDHLISAPPGYWFLRLTCATDDENHAMHGPLKLTEGLVIAWRIKNGEMQNPVTYNEMPSGNWDSALELPDGRCIADGEEIYPDRETWLTQSIAAYEESKADEAEMFEAEI